MITPTVELKSEIHLTFDIDWAHDEVLADTIELVEAAGVAATWFVTHDTPLLSRLRGNRRFELGIHPNFNFLLQGDDRNGRTAAEVIDRLLQFVPEAKSVRSHSITQNTGVLDLFRSRKLTHDCNHFIPEQTQIELKPWIHWNGLIRVPYFWEDDVWCLSDENTALEALIQRAGLKVFNFHPIHIFLNTERLDRYERTRSLHQRPDELEKHRYDGIGTRTRMLDLLAMTSAVQERKAGGL
ncbi:hypothetical protein [Polaromonas aquatica]|uniref:polysaccharide deacetylase WbmS family protein n=1 Tax=Polaromonas aquatica TaxID=332657 RepID=UPI003D652CFC